MTIKDDLNAAVAKAQAAAEILRAVANGPASGVGSTVNTAAGAVKTLSKLMADIEADFAANAVIAEVDADRVAAEAARVGAETAEANAEAAAAAAEAAANVGNVRVSATDVAAAPLDTSLVLGGGLKKTVQNAGGDETLLLAADAPVVSIVGADTIVSGHRAKTLACSGTFTLAVTAAATLGDGFFCHVVNVGSGTVTLDPNSTETADGATTLALTANQSVTLVCTGGAFYTLRGLSSAQTVTKITHFKDTTRRTSLANQNQTYFSNLALCTKAANASKLWITGSIPLHNGAGNNVSVPVLTIKGSSNHEIIGYYQQFSTSQGGYLTWNAIVPESGSLNAGAITMDLLVTSYDSNSNVIASTMNPTNSDDGRLYPAGNARQWVTRFTVVEFNS